MVSKTMEFLFECIKLAFPLDQTVDFRVGNAQNRRHNTYIILVEHYDSSLEARLEDLKDVLTQDCKKAFKVAVRWVKQAPPRIPQDVLDHAEVVINASGTRTSPEIRHLFGSSPRASPTTNSSPADPVPNKTTSASRMTDQEEERGQDWSPLVEIYEFPKDQRRRRGRKTIGVIINKPPSPCYFYSDMDDLEERTDAVL